MLRLHAYQFRLQYSDPQLISKVKEVTGDSLHQAFDSFASDESQVLTVEVLAPGKGHVIVALPTTERVQSLRKDVQVECS